MMHKESPMQTAQFSMLQWPWLKLMLGLNTVSCTGTGLHQHHELYQHQLILTWAC